MSRRTARARRGGTGCTGPPTPAARGGTWGWRATHHISRIHIHPRDPSIVYVAAVGRLWGASPERGVYRTTNGGESWELVLFVDENTGAIDLAMDPSDPETLFAAMYQRQRTGWGFNGGGPGSGIYRTTDGGASWVELANGLPDGDMGRIGLDIFRGDGNLVFAIVEADKRTPGQGFGGSGGGASRNGVYRSTDRGESWEQVSTTNNRPMYYSPDPGGSQRSGAHLHGRVEPCTSRPTAATPSRPTRPARFIPTTTPCGSTPPTPTTSFWAATAASRSAGTAPAPGAS